MKNYQVKSLTLLPSWVASFLCGYFPDPTRFEPFLRNFRCKHEIEKWLKSRWIWKITTQEGHVHTGLGAPLPKLQVRLLPPSNTEMSARVPQFPSYLEKRWTLKKLLFLFVSLMKTSWKTSFSKQTQRNFFNGFSGQKSFRYFRETRALRLT